MNIPKPLVQLNQSFIIISVMTGLIFSNWILLIPFLIGVITLITKKSPIIQVGKSLLKKPFKEYDMEDRDQQLFNQWIATISIGLSILFFQIEFTLLGYVFSIMVVLAATLALMGYCIGCTIRYRYKMWRYQKFTN
ncbi:hypothetical protein CR194_06695 [Salipaludibacillus keqinensis]|uniref:DUF4395 domain-containing protein n=1 Tax=Salipaludibacillus keqinensis TaxID=2045207 RepID=A0A323TJY3_9BACI|nr:DUF4395 domain-containing protein [Salipaludibacillus keqinensis]PYZ95198.1 hypothetical protein CR194_06695 [Salipaludibacillus keqinensis]